MGQKESGAPPGESLVYYHVPQNEPSQIMVDNTSLSIFQKDTRPR